MGGREGGRVGGREEAILTDQSRKDNPSTVSLF